MDFPIAHADLAGVTIAFDLDGTLVDTAPDLIGAFNDLAASDNIAPVDLSDARHLIGLGVKPLIVRAYASAGVTLSEAELDARFQSYLPMYASRIAKLSRPFDGTEAVLQHLKQSGARLAVCTNKLTGLSEQLLEALGLSGYFGAIVGADGVANKKPHPDHFFAAVARAGGVPGRAVMIGDSVTDVATARAAGAPVIAFDFGYTDVPPQDLGADKLLSHFRDLPAAIRAVLTAQGLASAPQER